MEEIIEYTSNDVHRTITRLMEDLRENTNPEIDHRIRAIILTHLQTAQLFSLELIKRD
jgi:hypothetical protein